MALSVSLTLQLACLLEPCLHPSTHQPALRAGALSHFLGQVLEVKEIVSTSEFHHRVKGPRAWCCSLAKGTTKQVTNDVHPCSELSFCLSLGLMSHLIIIVKIK